MEVEMTEVEREGCRLLAAYMVSHRAVLREMEFHATADDIDGVLRKAEESIPEVIAEAEMAAAIVMARKT